MRFVGAAVVALGCIHKAMSTAVDGLSETHMQPAPIAPAASGTNTDGLGESKSRPASKPTDKQIKEVKGNDGMDKTIRPAGLSKVEMMEHFEAECRKRGDDRIITADCPGSVSRVNIGGEVWLDVEKSTDAMNGQEGVVYRTSDPRLVIKISKRFDMCREIAALQALDGLGGFAPRMYPLDKTDPGINSDCVQKVIVMDAVGDKTFTEIPAPSVKDTYTRLGKLVEAIKTLHATGISHGDLHGNNIRVNSADPSKVFLVDFGLVEKGINEKDLSELCFRAAVPHREEDPFVNGFCIATGVEVIDSDFWIELFRRLGDDPTGLDEATLTAVEKIRQESVDTLLGRVNQLLKELSPENGEKTKIAILTLQKKLQKTATGRLETEMEGALVKAKEMQETKRRLINLTYEVVSFFRPNDLDKLKVNFAEAEAALAKENPTNDPGIAAYIQKLIREMEDEVKKVEQKSMEAEQNSRKEDLP